MNNSADVLDSREVITRLETLALLHQAGAVNLEETEGGEPGDNDTDQDSLFHEESVLSALATEAGDYSEDWAYGATLIRDSYFVEYAQELAEECADSREEADFIRNGGDHWPLTCAVIDWERAARELQQDYTSVDFDGVTYWVR